MNRFDCKYNDVMKLFQNVVDITLSVFDNGAGFRKHSKFLTW